MVILAQIPIDKDHGQTLAQIYCYIRIGLCSKQSSGSGSGCFGWIRFSELRSDPFQNMVGSGFQNLVGSELGVTIKGQNPSKIELFLQYL